MLHDTDGPGHPPGREDGGGAHTYAIRRASVLEALGRDAMVLTSGHGGHPSGGREVRFRPDSNVLYLAGWNEPDSVLVLRGHGTEVKFVAFVRDRDPAEESWSGPRAGVEGAMDLLEADIVLPIEALGAELGPLLQGADRVHFTLGTGGPVESAVVGAVEWARGRGARRGLGPHAVVDPLRILGPMRRVKSGEEIECLVEAARVTRETFDELDAFVRPGIGEWEIEALMEGGFRARGSRGPAFLTIVGSGPNGCVLHYRENARRVGPGELVVVDGGAEVGWYASDMTRTYLSSASHDGRPEEIHALVDRARRDAIAEIRPGIGVDRVHERARATLLEGLLGLGLVRGRLDDLLERRQERAFFPHQTSHWLGLDVHDVGDYSVDGEPVLLEPGMVLTVEPGLYFPLGGAELRLHAARAPEPARGPVEPPPVIDRVDEEVAAGFEGIGVRIEDTVLVTPEGRRVLTRSSPDPT